MLQQRATLLPIDPPANKLYELFVFSIFD